MSSKLKVKKKTRFPVQTSNQAAQAFGRAMQNCYRQVKDVEQQAYEDGFTVGEDWSNTINTVTTMMALRRLYGFSTKEYTLEYCAEQMNVSISTAKRLSRRVNNKIIKVC